MLQRPEGATIAEVVEATGWQPHTVRGAFAGALKKRLGLTVVRNASPAAWGTPGDGLHPPPATKGIGLGGAAAAARTPGRQDR